MSGTSTCPVCFTKIGDKWVLFSRAKYHPDCFTCTKCHKVFDPAAEVCKNDGGMRICVDCAKKDDPSIGEVKICGGCSKSIDKQWVIGIGKKWHPDCFKCKECKRVIDPKEKFYKVTVDDKEVPKCVDCKATGQMKDMDIKDKKCGGCGKEIENSWVVALNEFWHHGCFKCSHCGREIDSKESFNNNLGKPICMGCNNDHFRKKCSVCGKPIAGTSLIYKENAYHHSCVDCYVCGKALQEGDHEKIRIVNGKDFKHVDCNK